MEEEKLKIGVVGLGLMGSSIAAAMVLLGHRVFGVSPVPSAIDQTADVRIRRQVTQSVERGLVKETVEDILKRLHLSDRYSSLSGCDLIIENVIENLETKHEVLQSIEAAVGPEAIITSNTSAIPINTLQQSLERKHRFLGMHWSEPAFTSRFMEIICGDETDPVLGEQLQQLAESWGKEPTLVRKDIRGFVTNRLMYAMYREAFYLVENGYASMEDLDRACRNDAGVWLAFCGPFRYMDLTGLQAYYHVMKDLFPELDNRTTVPEFVERIAREGGNGISNGRGFYRYTPEEAKAWEEAFEAFSFDMERLKEEHPPKELKKGT
jgi:3-hydroxybutyryl-CoA dehydrogenase